MISMLLACKKKKHLIEMENVCNIINHVFTGTVYDFIARWEKSLDVFVLLCIS